MMGKLATDFMKRTYAKMGKHVGEYTGEKKPRESITGLSALDTDAAKARGG
jgi:hypothetical protein